MKSISNAAVIIGLLAASAVANPATELGLPANPTGKDLQYKGLLSKPLVVIGEWPSEAETLPVVEAISEYKKGRNPKALQDYLEQNPGSRFGLWISASLAKDHYRKGRYSDSMELLETTWTKYKSTFLSGDRRQTFVSEVAVDLAALYARLGRKNELKSLLDEIKEYPVTGPASERLARTNEGYTQMLLSPGRSFNCGPFALANVLRAESAPENAIRAISDAEGTTAGFSLAQLEKLARDNGLDYSAAEIGEDGELAFPCVVHWKADHYAAALRLEGGKIRVIDPTFRKDFLMSKEDFLREASGNFLIKGSPPSGWTKLSASKAGAVFGKGSPSEKNDDDDPCPEECGSSPGMASYGYDKFLLAVTITDTPLFLESPYGPGMNLTLSYHQAAKYEQRALGNGSPGDLGVPFTNVGTKWAHNWCSFVVADPVEITKMRLFLPDGRRETHIDNGSGYDRHRMSQALLSATTGGYKRTANDNSEMLFEYSATDAGVTRYYLTKIVDAQDNEITISYAPGPGSVGTRITEIEDPFGRKLIFEYDTTNVLQVTKVREQVNSVMKRETTLGYTTSGELEDITDMEGIVSSLSYDDAAKPDQVTSMTTPYGTTQFSNTSWDVAAGAGTHTYRSLSITDPEGLTEHLLYIPRLSGYHNFGDLDPYAPTLKETSNEDPSYAEVPYEIRYQDLDETLTLHWDKRASKYHPPNFQTGKNFEFANTSVWMQGADSGTYVVEPFVVSARSPETNRAFWSYDSPWDPSIRVLPDSFLPVAYSRLVQNELGQFVAELTEYTYTSNGLTESVTAPLGRITEYAYATNGIDVEEVRIGVNPGTADKVVAKMAYGGTVPHLPTEIYDAANNKTTIMYNSMGQVTQVTNALNEVYDFTYTWPTGFVDPDTNENDGFLQSVKVTDSANSITAVEVVNMTYHADTGFLHEVTDPRTGIKTTYSTYDALGRPTKITHADQSTEEFFYQRDGVKILDLVKHLNREGLYSHYEYNGNRQLVKSTDPAQRVNRLIWCSCGHIEALIDALGRRTEWKRDILGRVSTKILPDGKEISYTYEPESGRLETITYPNEQGTANPSVELRYFPDGSLAEKTYPGDTDPFFAKYTYGSLLGRLETAKWHNETGVEKTSSYGYHSFSTSLGTGVTGTLGAGQLHTIDGPWVNDTVVYEYDELNRAIATSIGDDSAPYGNPSYSTEITEIDGFGRVTEIVNGLGTFTTSYSGNESRPDYMVGPGGSNNFKVDYFYLSAANGGYLSQIKNTWSTTTVSQFDYTYRSDGKIKTWKKLQGGTTADYMEFVYDFAGQLTKSVTKETDSSGNVLNTLTFGYDRAGNRTAKIEDDDPFTAEFNSRNQLNSGTFTGKIPFIGHLNEFADVEVSVGGETRQAQVREADSGFLFETKVQLSDGTSTLVDVLATDQNSNQTSESYMISQGTGQWATLAHDDNGNTDSRTVTKDSVTTVDTFTWDRESRLESITRGGVTTRFVYNAAGERVKIIYDYGGSSEEKQLFVWCGGLQPCQRRDSTNAVTRNYYPQGEEHIAGSTTVEYLYTRDHLGSVRELVASSDGTVVARYDYTPFGERSTIGSPTVDTEISYTGHYQEPASGYYLTLFRAYDSELGRWLSADPLESVTGEMPEMLPEGSNLYAYVGGNPVNGIDDLGLEVRCYAAPAFTGEIETGAWHIFFFSDTPGVGGVGTGQGSSGGRRSSGVPAGFDPRTTRLPSSRVNLPVGMTDQQFIDYVRKSRRLNSGWYTPVINDCHSQAKDAANDIGVTFERPKKRFSLGEFIVNWTEWMTAFN